MTDYKEFAAKIKEKYPQYKDIDDLTLAQRVVEKYPQYKEKVEFSVKEVEKPKAEKRNIDLTPSGLYKNALVSGIGAPLRMAIKGEDYQTAREKGIQNLENNKPAGGIADLLFDLGVYSKLPVAKGGGAANFIKNALVQGGVTGAIEGLKHGGTAGSALGGAAMGTGIASGIQAALPPAAKVVGAGLQKAANSNFVKNQLPKVLNFLTSVPADYSKRAIEKEKVKIF